MSGFTRLVDHSELYASDSSRGRSHTATDVADQSEPHTNGRRNDHSPSRSASASSSSLTFSKEHEISAPARRSSGLAAALNASRSRREHSISRSISAEPYSTWSTRGRAEDEEYHAHHHGTPLHQAHVVEMAAGPPVGDAALPCSLRVFLHRSITGSIAASSHKHKHSISSSASSSPPSLSSSSSCSSIHSSGGSLASILFHVNEPCSLARLKCEVIAACTAVQPSPYYSPPSVDILSLSSQFDVVAASAAGSADEECPPLSPHQCVHQFGVEALLFVLRATDEAICWWQWRLPQDERWLGPRVMQPPPEQRLLQAAREGDVDAVRLLLDAGTPVDAVDESDSGCSALHHAAAFGHTALIHMLCKRSADVELKDRRGRTPLHCAVQAAQVDCAETLVLWGASVWAEDGGGRNAMVAARESGSADMVCMMQDMMEDDGQAQITPQLDAQEWS